MLRIFAGVVLVLAVVSPLSAQGIINPTISGNQVTAGISLPGDLGADLTITFENAVGLSVDNLGLSASVVNLLDPGLLSRLSSLVSIPAGFPVLLRIEPPATGGLSFSGLAAIELHTHNLAFTAGCPLRLFAAPLGGQFQDITESMGTGSYRVRGTRGSFSEFLILIDLRSVNTVISGKFDRLEALLTDNGPAIAAPVLADLTTLLHDARAAYQANQILTSVQKIEAFLAEVQAHSGADIPNVWRSSRDLVNVAGLLRAGGGTLRFSLNLKADSGL